MIVWFLLWGRDSSYPLLLQRIKNEANCLSYDWGMLTDLKRNQAIMCGALGVEHILVSANIRKKKKI